MADMQPDMPRHQRGDDERSLGSWSNWFMLLILAGVLAFAVEAGHQAMVAKSNNDQAQQQMVHAMGLITPAPKGLAGEFSDSQGRLLADPPADPSQLIDPQTIVVAHLESSDPETPAVDWTQFDKHLSETIGRKVADETFDNGPASLKQIADGKLTLVALHAADAPFLVNNYGFQPCAVLGDESGASGNHLDIIVPANSPIAQLTDLRGHSLVCTVPSSITGYRAAVVMLLNDQGLRPNVDYMITWSLGQKKSITGVADKTYDAAAISDDKLQSLLDKGTVTESEYKTVYQSEVIPRTTIGWFYNLNPKLAGPIRDAVLSFRPTSSPDGGKPLHFIGIDYKKDFQTVRQIDDQFDPRLDSKTKGQSKESESSAM